MTAECFVLSAIVKKVFTFTKCAEENKRKRIGTIFISVPTVDAEKRKYAGQNNKRKGDSGGAGKKTN